VAGAGDINGDGFDDLLVGAFGADPNGYESGASYVVFGKSGGFGPHFELVTLNGENGFQINGVDTGDLSGRRLASAGDVNGDGLSDILIGAFGADPNGANSGSSYVVFGREGASDPILELSSLNGLNGFQINGASSFDNSGVAVSGAGDINGDGLSDLIIGAGGASGSGTGSGACYVVFGRQVFEPSLELSGLDGANGFRISGARPGDHVGYSVAGAGDINGDGFDDLVIGAYLASSERLFSGATYVVFGRAEGFSADLDLGGLDGANGFRLNGEAAMDFAGCSAAGAGDVNGDGYDDLIIGAREADPNGGGSGASYVVFGKAGGFDPGFELSELDGNNGFKILGESAGQYSGSEVAGAGDVNGDGYDDLIIGASKADTEAGTYVVFGRAPTASVNWMGSARGQTFRAGAFDDLIDGAGGDDVIYGGQGSDNLSGAQGDDVLFGGAGNDVLSGGEGLDVAVYSGNRSDYLASFDGVVTTLTDLRSGRPEGVDQLIGVEQVRFDDGSFDISSLLVGVTIVGTAASETISPFKYPKGQTGPTALNDTLLGLGGNDVLDGAGGADRLFGGLGNDTYVVDNRGDETLELANEGTDTVKSNISWTLSDNVENLTLTGTGVIDGLGNGLANVLVGNASTNKLSGGGGTDKLDGGAGDDILFGGEGTDTLIGGLGADALYGGAAKDIFVFNTIGESPVGSSDRIWDFDALDVINLKSIDANASLAGNQAFAFIGSSAFAVQSAGQVRFELAGADTLIQVETNGDGLADLEIRLVGYTTAINSKDFIL
jgi:Ca2+-binding RTX toxin-like protein